jgi:hypothetical protein
MLLPEMQVLARVSRLPLGSVSVVQATTAQGGNNVTFTAMHSQRVRPGYIVSNGPCRACHSAHGPHEMGQHSLREGNADGASPRSTFPHRQASTTPLQSHHPSHGRATISKGWRHRSHQEQAAGPLHVCEQRFRARLWFQRWSFSSKARGAQKRKMMHSQPLHYGGSEVGEAL